LAFFDDLIKNGANANLSSEKGDKTIAEFLYWQLRNVDIKGAGVFYGDLRKVFQILLNNKVKINTSRIADASFFGTTGNYEHEHPYTYELTGEVFNQDQVFGEFLFNNTAWNGIISPVNVDAWEKIKIRDQVDFTHGLERVVFLTDKFKLDFITAVKKHIDVGEIFKRQLASYPGDLCRYISKYKGQLYSSSTIDVYGPKVVLENIERLKGPAYDPSYPEAFELVKNVMKRFGYTPGEDDILFIKSVLAEQKDALLSGKISFVQYRNTFYSKINLMKDSGLKKFPEIGRKMVERYEECTQRALEYLVQ
jgi:hypothetical protein